MTKKIVLIKQEGRYSIKNEKLSRNEFHLCKTCGLKIFASESILHMKKTGHSEFKPCSIALEDQI